MDVIQSLRDKAKADPQTIVFPEANDDRVTEAVKYIKDEGIAKPLLLTQDNLDPERQEEFATFFHERKQVKGITFEEARELMENPLYYGCMMTRFGYADGFVAGADHMSKDVIIAAMKSFGVDRSVGVVSGAFLMEIESCNYGDDGFFIFTDCAVTPMPSAKQLARIAIPGGDLLKKLFGIQPKIALITYSSHGSDEGESIDRVKASLPMIKEKRPDFLVDGELQTILYS